MAVAHPTPPDEAPPPPPQPANLESALDTVVAALAQAIENAVGGVLPPSQLQGIRQVIKLTLNQKRPKLVEAAAADAPFDLEALVAKSFSILKNPGLVNWIPDKSKKSRASDKLLYLRDYVGRRNGNFARSEFQEFLDIYVDVLDLRSQRADSSSALGRVCNIIKDAVFPFRSVKGELGEAARCVKRVCDGVREIGNKYSHPPAQSMSDADMYELCGYFQALGAAMPIVVAELLRPPPSPVADPVLFSLSAFLTASNATAVRPQDLQRLADAVVQQLSAKHRQPNPTISASSNHTQVTTLPSPANISSPLEFTTVATTSNSPRGWETVSTSPLRQRSPTAVPASSPESKAIVPTQATLAAVRSFKYYYDRPTYLPKETDGKRMAMFARMTNRMKVVDKANLCLFTAGHDAKCQLSHSYLEVMRYNPLFKLIVCQQYDHYHGRDVVENNNCGGCHVDVGIRLLDAILETKKKRCLDGESCRNNYCHKSHSFEEMCWYNPSNKTQLCHPTRCRGNAMECPYAHDGELREWKTEDDYVGKNVPMLFIERTHKPLADALEALRYARAHNL